jgi:hypothetical protein
MQRLIVVIVITALVTIASATSFRDAQLTATATEPEAIIAGRVLIVKAERDRHRIMSRVTLELAGGGRVEFLAPGGSLDGVTMRVAGAPHFIAGDQAQVMLRHTPSGLRLAGLGSLRAVP